MATAHDYIDLIGSTCSLKVTRRVDAGLILQHGTLELLLPHRLSSGSPKEGEQVSVFVYTDSEDRPIATMQTPLAQVGDFAFLEVVDENNHGCFLDWGLEKDLFCPRAEQHHPMAKGTFHVVAVYLDNHTARVAAASKLSEFFDYDLSPLQLNQQVNLLAFGSQPRGMQVIVDDRYCGIVYYDQNFMPLRVGDRGVGYVDGIRPDNKIDIRLNPKKPKTTREKVTDARGVVLAALQEQGGRLEIGDKSPPSEVYNALSISKKAFKAAVGQLYKEGLVTPGATSTIMVPQEPSDSSS